MKTLKKHLPLILTISAVALAVATMLILYFTVIRPKPNENLKTVSLIIVFSDERFEYKDIKTESGTLLDLLNELNDSKELGFEENEGSWGYEIIALKGKTREADCYFIHFVNGEFGDNSVDLTVLEEGTEYEIQYLKYNADFSSELQPLNG